MKKNREARKSKIITYYALAIVIPSILLGILAFRGVRNDQALVEREQRRIFLDVAESIAVQTGTELQAVDSTFDAIAMWDDAHAGLFFTDSVMELFVERTPLVAGVFHLSPDGDIQMLQAGPTCIPEGAVPDMAGEQPPPSTSVTEVGWQYEFRDKDYNKAIAYYSRALQISPDEWEKGRMLNIIARLQKKKGDTLAALGTYSLIHDNYGQVYLSGQIPLGSTALREMIRINLRTGNLKNA